MDTRTFCIGDIHGAHKALIQCLERSNFNYANDTLICLGDVVDGWPETPQCIEELLKIKKLIYIMGNHCVWASTWFQCGDNPLVWTSQGGQATINAYKRYPNLKEKHKYFFRQSVPFYVDNQNRLYVHGGYNPNKPIENQMWDDLYWDRTLFNIALSVGGNIGEYKEIYIGHTTTSHIDKRLALVNKGNVWMLDQGAGYEGKLSIINVDTHEFWQSDLVSTLYPGQHGR